LTLNLRSKGRRNPETIRNLGILAEVMANTGRVDSALVLAEQAVDFARRGPGRRSLAAADAMLTYGHSLQVKGDARRARAMLEAAIAVYRTHPDSARPRLAASLVNLGFLDDQEERFDSAEIRMRESLAIRRAILAPDDPKLLNSIAALAGVLLNTGAVAEAERLAEEAVAMGQSIYPDGHPRRATLAAQLAEARDRAGKPADAERRYRESLEALRDIRRRPDPGRRRRVEPSGPLPARAAGRRAVGGSGVARSGRDLCGGAWPGAHVYGTGGEQPRGSAARAGTVA
jgi:tetratricopeptide (TPR) repeat protein